MSERAEYTSINHAFELADESPQTVQFQLQQGSLPNLTTLQERCLSLCEAVLASPEAFTKALSLKFEAILGEVERLTEGVEALEKNLNERPKAPRRRGTKIYGQRAEEL